LNLHLPNTRMLTGEINRKNERTAGIFLLAAAVFNAVTVIRVVPWLRAGYQDFTAFYGGGLMVRYGQTASLYHLQTEFQLRHQVAPGILIPNAAPYIHPPFEALLFVPLTWLGYQSAYALWSFLSICLLAWSLQVLRKTYVEISRLNPFFVFLAAAGWLPVARVLIQGQDSFVFLLVMMYSLSYSEADRDIAAGAILAAGLFRFQLVLPMAFILAARRWRLLLGFLPAAAGLAALSAWMVGREGLMEYVNLLFRMEKTETPQAIIATMPNLRGLVALLSGGEGRLALVITAILSAAVMGIALWQVRRPNTPMRLVFAVASVAAILVSFHTFSYDLTLLLPVVLLLFTFPECATQEQTQRDTILLTVVFSIALASSMWQWLKPFCCVPVLLWMLLKSMRPQAAGPALPGDQASAAI
jgi:hypothetical protein